MTLPGGPASKFGNRYEKWWTLSEFVRMLQGKSKALRIEEPGIEKAEFVVANATWREFHQAKRSHPNGKWSLAALGCSLVKKIGNQLLGNSDRFIFASGSASPELAELCEAARHSESVTEFERFFITAKRRAIAFRKLRLWWACDMLTAFDFLRRIEVRTIGDRELEDKVEAEIEALFLANPRYVLAELLRIIEDSTHCTITRDILVEKLRRLGYPLRRVRSPEHAYGAVREVTEAFLSGARAFLIQKRLVPRIPSQLLLSRLQGPPTDSVLTGRAGSGKTACVLELVEALCEADMPILAFRLDRVPQVSTTADLGKHLGLEESPALVLAAAAEAAGRPGIMIVDQLDAVSTMSGRSSGTFDLVERLLNETRAMRLRAAIHTVVVCRAFDWENDSRLRKLMPDSQARVDVPEFTVEEASEILVSAGFDPDSFHQNQVELLRLPQNLSLFFDAGFEPVQAPMFSTAKELFDQYWKEKRLSVAQRVMPAPDQWMGAIEIVCDGMTANQQLSVVREKLDAIQPDYLNQLASEGVLNLERGRYGFGHESFFDYCFARLFFNRSGSLVSFLKASEQHLFRRAQTRQVLVYLRDRDFDRYLIEFCDLLSDEDIRTHIKDLAFALLSEVTDPTKDEWAIWQEWIKPAVRSIGAGTPNTTKLSEVAWQRFFGSQSWFRFADQSGLINAWFSSESDGIIDMAMNYLKVHHRHSPDRVATLLELYANRNGELEQQYSVFMEWAELHMSRRLFDLFLSLVDNGTLDELIAGRSHFWIMLRKLAEHRPEWLPEVVAHQFQRQLAITRATEETIGPTEFIGYDKSAVEVIVTSAEQAPGAFVEHVLPVVLEISDSNLIEEEPPKRDTVWRYLLMGDDLRGEDACLSGLTKALSVLSRNGESLCNVIVELRSLETHIANHLLLALYGGGASRFADEAVALLCDEPWRFQCGFSDNPNWCAMELIREVVPHCSDQNRKRLETVVLDYTSPFERSRTGYKWFGHSRFALLSSIPAELRRTRSNAHFRELTRKFVQPLGKPRGVGGGMVQSPIEKTAAEKMRDGQWLLAIAKYRTDDWVTVSHDELRGGAFQLAQMLEIRVKEDPNRFARLSLQFPADRIPCKAILAGLKNASISDDIKLQVCRKAFAEPSLWPVDFRCPRNH